MKIDSSFGTGLQLGIFHISIEEKKYCGKLHTYTKQFIFVHEVYNVQRTQVTTTPKAGVQVGRICIGRMIMYHKQTWYILVIC